MSNTPQTSFINTRAKAKLKLIVNKEPFVPTHRSTEIPHNQPSNPQPHSSNPPPLSPSRGSDSDSPTFLDSPNYSPGNNTLRSSDQRSPQSLSQQEISTPVPPQSNLNKPVTAVARVPGLSQKLEEDLITLQHNNNNNTNPRNTTNMANITLQESMATEKIPATPKFLCPSLFNPGSDDALHFIKQYDRTSAANGWNNALRIAYLPSFLEGAAGLWFEKYKEDEDNSQKTWTQMKDDFLQEFGVHNPKNILEKQLYARKQKEKEGIREYYFNLLDLFGEYDPSLNPQEFKNFFENGLRKDLYNNYRLLIDDDDIDWKTFRKTINKLEDIAAYTIQSKEDTHTCMCQHASGTSNSQRQPNHGRTGWTPHQHRFGPPPNKNENNNANWHPRPSHQNPRWQNPNLQPPKYNYQRGNNYPQNQIIRPNRGPPQYNGFPTTNTRNHDGRPRCYKCNKIGHHPAVCRQSQQDHPNDVGRRM